MDFYLVVGRIGGLDEGQVHIVEQLPGSLRFGGEGRLSMHGKRLIVGCH